MSGKNDSTKNKTVLSLCMIIAAGAVLALLLILPLRGIMNAVNRLDYISQRLDDYPRMNAVYLQETEEWWNSWRKELYDQRARQAALIYSSDEKHTDEGEKLAYIAEVLQAETAQIVSPEEYREISGKEGGADFSAAGAELGDGRVIVLSFLSSTENSRKALMEDDTFFLSQVEAGLPGYICVLREGALSVYPKDENEEALRNMIGSMLESGKLDPAGLAAEAGKNGEKAALKVMLNPRTEGVPARKYLLYSAAYSDNNDFVINVSDSSTLFRFGRKRSWALWFLCCAIMALLGHSLWKTRLYRQETGPQEEHLAAVKQSISAMFLGVLLLLGSVFVIQMLSSVNLAQQGATDQAVYLKEVLGQESERAVEIEKEFDDMYLFRARTAARILSDNPQLIDTDFLYSLDHSMNGAGMRVFNTDGLLLASDELLNSAVDTSMVSMAHAVPGSGQIEEPQQAAGTEEGFHARFYRAIMTGEEGKTTGWVELCARQDQLDDLLRETGMQEVVGDLHIMDTLHAVAVEKTAEGRITASTWKNWVGDPAEEHGIHTDLLYDGYEGIVSFDGNKCYSVVFDYGNSHVIVGSENETALVFIGGVLILTWLLAMLMLLAVYRPLVRRILAYQKQLFLADPEGRALAGKREYPPLTEYNRDFMIAVFLLSAVLFFTTKGNPAGLTYNIVRGTWIRGVNAATITTSIMLASVVFAVQRLIDIILLRMGKYLSPKGMTVCRLIDSGLTYIGTIVMIIYALSMFGVNTTTLIGGVGATALIFTLGANSLIADVLAGIFIIFEGDFTVGDVVVIDDFRGIVTDISMRTTKLMDDNTRDIKIINNSEIRELTNQSRENSAVIVDIPISRSMGLEKGEAIVQEAIRKLPEMHPKIIGTPQYWGISKLPEKNKYTGKLGGFNARIAFDCLEMDKEMLTYQVYRSLIDLVTELNAATPAEPAGEKTGTEKAAESGKTAVAEKAAESGKTTGAAPGN